MRKRLLIAIVIIASTLTIACVYRAPLAQGNLLDQEDIDQVELGMTRGQVRFLLGTPMIDDSFNANRWDYVYYLKIRRDQAVLKRWISVHFDDDNVKAIIQDQELRRDL